MYVWYFSAFFPLSARLIFQIGIVACNDRIYLITNRIKWDGRKSHPSLYYGTEYLFDKIIKNHISTKWMNEWRMNNNRNCNWEAWAILIFIYLNVCFSLKMIISWRSKFISFDSMDFYSPSIESGKNGCECGVFMSLCGRYFGCH